MPQTTAIDPNEAVLAARKRRLSQAVQRSKREQWFIDNVANTVYMTVRQRMVLATEFLKTKIIRNISRPVTKSITQRLVGGKTVSRIVVDESSRSKPGQFPKADTTMLMKTIFSDVVEIQPGLWDGFVGTPLDYGVILETKMERSFLVRTLHEERPRLTSVLTGPIKG